jgi:hypothetical protein
VPSIFKIIRSTTALARIFPILDLNCEENVVRRSELLKLKNDDFITTE